MGGTSKDEGPAQDIEISGDGGVGDAERTGSRSGVKDCEGPEVRCKRISPTGRNKTGIHEVP